MRCRREARGPRGSGGWSPGVARKRPTPAGDGSKWPSVRGRELQQGASVEFVRPILRVPLRISTRFCGRHGLARSRPVFKYRAVLLKGRIAPTELLSYAVTK